MVKKFFIKNYVLNLNFIFSLYILALVATDSCNIIIPANVIVFVYTSVFNYSVAESHVLSCLRTKHSASRSAAPSTTGPGPFHHRHGPQAFGNPRLHHHPPPPGVSLEAQVGPALGPCLLRRGGSNTPRCCPVSSWRRKGDRSRFPCLLRRGSFITFIKFLSGMSVTRTWPGTGAIYTAVRTTIDMKFFTCTVFKWSSEGFRKKANART